MQQFNTATKGCKFELIRMQIHTLGESMGQDRLVSTSDITQFMRIPNIDDFYDYEVIISLNGGYLRKDPLSGIMAILIRMIALREAAHSSFIFTMLFDMAQFL